jgi:hypothetical protein
MIHRNDCVSFDTSLLTLKGVRQFEGRSGLVHAQARDWLFYVFSSMWLLDVTPSQAAAIMMTYLKQDDLAVQTTVKKSCGTLAWLRFLPSKRKPWGRDVVAAQGAGAILHELQKLQ